VKRIVAAYVSMLVALLAISASAQAADRLEVYKGKVSRGQLAALTELGIDRHELQLKGTRSAGKIRVELILSGSQARALRRQGISLSVKNASRRTARARAAQSMEVFRPYSGAGGIQQEYEQAARDNRKIAKLVNYGTTVQGKRIVALKVTKDPWKSDGRKPAVLYLGAQHAREWITPEMNRRLMHYFLDGYNTNRKIRKLIDTRELWFVPVANPDGYDFSFTEGNRLWRKNLRDNNGDGQITPGDGVDLNRNFATKWGYDNEGSSPDPGSETYRGPGPNSEPETQALDRLVRNVGFEFFVNYHSAAELLLYGTGWQVATPTPDDVIYEAMAGDDANPAIPGYDPDISAELYTTNGDTDTHMTEKYGTLGFTPEMSTCEAASDSVEGDEWEAEDCESGFNFPDDEGLVQAEFEKNIPFALSVAKSADDPDDPESVVGRRAENFRVDTFEVSFGDPQTVAVVAKRAIRNLHMHYRIDGGRTRTADVREWRGGERYGDENDDYYAEFRGVVRGADRGDDVRVWFEGYKKGKGEVRSESFEYRLARDTGDDVLIVANEDYTGVNPTYPAGTDSPKYARVHRRALRQAGYSADVWDVDRRGVPHDLGVLDHYDAVVWYLGDNRITQDPEDELTQTPFGNLPDLSVAERQQYLTMSVRDYLNAGGKLIHAGETAQYEGLLGISDAVGGLYYGLNGDPEAECVISSVPGFFEDCLILANDFRQYYLGAFTRTDFTNPASVSGIADPIEGFFGNLAAGDNPLDEAGTFQPTSEVLPPDEFPQFTSQGAAEYPQAQGSPFAPVEGTKYAGALHADSSYMRLTKTVTVPANTPAQLQFQLSLNSETGYDHVIVEAHTPGQDNWTTLRDLNGGTTQAVPSECAQNGFLLNLHPFLRHYLSGTPCQPSGTSGAWNSFTGSTGGWDQVAFDLAAFTGAAGGPVELAITYVTDPATGGVGAFVDDTRIVVGGTVTEADGFEGATSTWTVSSQPAGSPSNSGNWQISERLLNFYAGTSTEDTLLLGFGLEHLSTDAERADLVRRALGGLLE
jgi:Zinc carboxypeptidase/Immune inhibitor A peptidase M6